MALVVLLLMNQEVIVGLVMMNAPEDLRRTDGEGRIDFRHEYDDAWKGLLRHEVDDD